MTFSFKTEANHTENTPNYIYVVDLAIDTFNNIILLGLYAYYLFLRECILFIKIYISYK